MSPAGFFDSRNSGLLGQTNSNLFLCFRLVSFFLVARAALSRSTRFVLTAVGWAWLNSERGLGPGSCLWLEGGRRGAEEGECVGSASAAPGAQVPRAARGAWL